MDKLSVYDTLDDLIDACNDDLTVISWMLPMFQHDKLVALVKHMDDMARNLRDNDLQL